MDINTCKRFLKQSVKNVSLKIIILSNFLTYISILFAATSRINNKGVVAILGGFLLKQNPSSIYVLEWILPRFVLIYILFINTYTFIEKGVYLVFTRIKSKMLFYFVVNIVCLLIIFIWYIEGYILVTLYCRFVFGLRVPDMYSILKMFFLDILATYLIFNIFYIFTLIFNKLLIGAFSSIFIYLMPIFMNNTQCILFKFLPSNHSMYLRQKYMHNSFLYFGIGLTVLIIMQLIIIKKIEIHNEGV